MQRRAEIYWIEERTVTCEMKKYLQQINLPRDHENSHQLASSEKGAEILCEIICSLQRQERLKEEKVDYKSGQKA
jgi:hypothetical protein